MVCLPQSLRSHEGGARIWLPVCVRGYLLHVAGGIVYSLSGDRSGRSCKPVRKHRLHIVGLWPGTVFALDQRHLCTLRVNGQGDPLQVTGDIIYTLSGRNLTGTCSRRAAPVGHGIQYQHGDSVAFAVPGRARAGGGSLLMCIAFGGGRHGRGCSPRRETHP